MVTYAIVTLPADEILLAGVMERLADCRVRIEESAFGGDASSVFVWVSTSDGADIEASLAADGSISDFTLVQGTADSHLYHLETDQHILLPRRIIREHGGTVQEASGHDAEWRLEVRFPRRSDLASADRAFEEYNIEVSYESIQSSGDEDGTRSSDLTDRQREALQLAHEMGYYDVPRAATLAEVAAEIGVSHQAVSERLRRAEDKLASNHLLKRTSGTGSTERRGRLR